MTSIGEFRALPEGGVGIRELRARPEGGSYSVGELQARGEEKGVEEGGFIEIWVWIGTGGGGWS